MDVKYFYCSTCGYEVIDAYIAYSRTCASGDFYICPACKKESSHINDN